MAKRHRRSFGTIRRLPSGNYRAEYTGEDGQLCKAPTTFPKKVDAEGWLATQQAAIVEGRWRPRIAATTDDVMPEKTLAEYAPGWLATRLVKGRPLTVRTSGEMEKLLRKHVLPRFGSVALTAITRDAVESWYLDELATTTGPTRRAHAYGLLRSILNTAVDRGLIDANPCRLKGAGSTRRQVKITVTDTAEITALIDAMPQHYRVMVAIAAWCGLRLGELCELRRHDIDVKHDVIHVRRAVTFVANAFTVGSPKSEAGVRDVDIPPHLVPVIRAHIVSLPRDGLLFPSPVDATRHLNPSTFSWHWRRARVAAGVPTLRFHDLRHSAATRLAHVGASLGDLKAFIGHSTFDAAVRYQHTAKGRGPELARLLSEKFAGNDATVVDIATRRTTA